ncbi:hypothetical protein MRX96_036181 [Rhipicephalus microplus]
MLPLCKPLCTSEPSQHNYSDLLRLHPSEMYGMDIATDYSPSENDDKTVTVSADPSKGDMKSSQENKAFAQAVSLANLPPVSLNSEMTCYVSVTIPKTLQFLKVYEEQLNGITVAQPSKYAAVLPSCCGTPTMPQPPPAPVHPPHVVLVVVVSSM